MPTAVTPLKSFLKIKFVQANVNVTIPKLPVNCPSSQAYFPFGTAQLQVSAALLQKRYVTKQFVFGSRSLQKQEPF
jgi:hypothetical protein